MLVELSCSVAKVVACALVNLCGIPGRIERTICRLCGRKFSIEFL
jgi:hypothetical protein